MLKQFIFKVLVLFLICNTQFLRSQNLVATYTETRKFEGKMPDDPDPKIRELVKNAGTHTRNFYPVLELPFIRKSRPKWKKVPNTALLSASVTTIAGQFTRIFYRKS